MYRALRGDPSFKLSCAANNSVKRNCVLPAALEIVSRLLHVEMFARVPLAGDLGQVPGMDAAIQRDIEPII